MTTKKINQESPENENRLLSSEERAILSQIPTKEAPHSWRAQVILAIDDGATQAEAGRQAGLTKGQVRYWLGKFRKDRTSIFPEELLNQAQQEESDSPQSSAGMLDPGQVAGEEAVQPEMPDGEETAGPGLRPDDWPLYGQLFAKGRRESNGRIHGQRQRQRLNDVYDGRITRANMPLDQKRALSSERRNLSEHSQ
jgi:hypothetical protein